MASKYTEQNADKVKEAHSTLYDAGLEMRNKVAGKEYVDRALSNATSDFARPMQEVRVPSPTLLLSYRPSFNPKLTRVENTASNRSSMGKHLDTTRSRSQD
jgi:4-carboxymuconolactone decarboxylase